MVNIIHLTTRRVLFRSLLAHETVWLRQSSVPIQPRAHVQLQRWTIMSKRHFVGKASTMYAINIVGTMESARTLRNATALGLRVTSSDGLTALNVSHLLPAKTKLKY